MNHEAATQLALGYAWGSEDGTGTLTAGDAAVKMPSSLFAAAFAQGWADYRDGKRGNMIAPRDAYANWQASGGLTVFGDGEETADHQRRSAAHRAAQERC